MAWFPYTCLRIFWSFLQLFSLILLGQWDIKLYFSPINHLFISGIFFFWYERDVSLGLLWWLSWLRIFLQCRRLRFDPWLGKISWRKKWQPTPVFLPGKCHGQRSLEGYSPRGHKESTQLSNETTTNWIFDQIHPRFPLLSEKFIINKNSHKSVKKTQLSIQHLLPIKHG